MLDLSTPTHGCAARCGVFVGMVHNTKIQLQLGKLRMSKLQFKATSVGTQPLKQWAVQTLPELTCGPSKQACAAA